MANVLPIFLCVLNLEGSGRQPISSGILSVYFYWSMWFMAATQLWFCVGVCQYTASFVVLKLQPCGLDQ